MNVRYSDLHCNLFGIWSKSSLEWTCWIVSKFSFLSCIKRARWKLFPRLQKCLVLSQLYGFWKTMTSQLESSRRIQNTCMYGKQLFEQEISQWRLLQLFDKLTWSSWLSIERLKLVHLRSLPGKFCFCAAFSQTATTRALFDPGNDVAEKSWTLINPGMNEKPGQALVKPLQLEQNTFSF